MSGKHPLLPLSELLADKMRVVKTIVFPATTAVDNPGSPTERDPSKHYEDVLKKGRSRG